MFRVENSDLYSGVRLVHKIINNAAPHPVKWKSGINSLSNSKPAQFSFFFHHKVKKGF